VGGVPPQIQNRGQVAHISKPGHEWDPKPWQTLSQRGWANGGSRGAKPPWQGVWGMCPQNKKRGQVAHLSKPATSGAQNSGEPSAHGGWAKLGSRGAEPPWQGVWGMCPQNKKRGQVAHISKPGHEWGPKPWQTLSQRGWANGGSRGAKPPWQGIWGMCPQNKKRGQVAHLSNPATSGTQNAGEP
jgi:hypothetical protein